MDPVPFHSLCYSDYTTMSRRWLILAPYANKTDLIAFHYICKVKCDANATFWKQSATPTPPQSKLWSESRRWGMMLVQTDTGRLFSRSPADAGGFFCACLTAAGNNNTQLHTWRPWNVSRGERNLLTVEERWWCSWCEAEDLCYCIYFLPNYVTQWWCVLILCQVLKYSTYSAFKNLQLHIAGIFHTITPCKSVAF